MDGTFSTHRVFASIGSLAICLLLAGPVGCSQFVGTTARSFLKTIRDNPDPNQRYIAYSKLASPQCYDDAAQKTEAVRMLTEKLEGSREPIASRAVICRTLGELHDPAARDALIKGVGDPEGVVRVQACLALGRVGQPDDATLLARVMTVDTLEDCRIAAIEGLGELKSKDPRILQVLVTGMEHDDPAIRLSSLRSLRQITGMDRGVDAATWRDALFPQPRPIGSPSSDTPTATMGANATGPAPVHASTDSPH